MEPKYSQFYWLEAKYVLELLLSALELSLIFRDHSEKYYSKNSYLGPEEMPVNKNPVGSTVFHANFIASVADTARIFYLK